MNFAQYFILKKVIVPQEGIFFNSHFHCNFLYQTAKLETIQDFNFKSGIKTKSQLSLDEKQELPTETFNKDTFQKIKFQSTLKCVPYVIALGQFPLLESGRYRPIWFEVPAPFFPCNFTFSVFYATFQSVGTMFLKKYFCFFAHKKLNKKNALKSCS